MLPNRGNNYNNEITSVLLSQGPIIYASCRKKPNTLPDFFSMLCPNQRSSTTHDTLKVHKKNGNQHNAFFGTERVNYYPVMGTVDTIHSVDNTDFYKTSNLRRVCSSLILDSRFDI